jgi:hypothetical protein
MERDKEKKRKEISHPGIGQRKEKRFPIRGLDKEWIRTEEIRTKELERQINRLPCNLFLIMSRYCRGTLRLLDTSSLM